MKNTIFVQIASYRDPELIKTIKDLVDKSDNPKNIRIVVCWQHAEDESLDIFRNEFTESVATVVNKTKDHFGNEFLIHKFYYNDAKIELIDVDYTKSHGACWARNFIQRLFKNEKYTLQLDSHHRFVNNFDTVMINMLEKLRKRSPKPLITAYLPSYDPDNEPNGRVQEAWKMNFDRFIPEGAVFFRPSKMESSELKMDALPARFYSAHFAFADGSFAKEVKHDPFYFFHGEEISISARAYTHGYDLYHPTRIVAWHEYTRKNRTKIWDDHTTINRNKGLIQLDWVQRNNSCHNRNRILFEMDGHNRNEIDFAEYGFGDIRNVEDYEKYSGINFKLRGVQSYTIDKLPPPNPVYSNNADYISSFIRSNDVKILLHTTELDCQSKDYDFWYVGVHDENNIEIYRKDLTPDEIIKHMSSVNGFVEFRFIYLNNKIASTYTVWPHSRTKGWRQKITKTIEN